MKLTYANVTSTVALFLALGGGTTAIALSGKNSVKHDDLANNVVKGAEINNGAVKSADIADKAVGSSELKDDTVKASDIAAGAVGASELQTVPVARIQGGGQTITDNAFTDVTVMDDTPFEAYDPEGMWDPGSPALLTVPRDGVYVIEGGAQFANDDTATPGGLLDQGFRLLQVSASNGENQRVVQPPNRFGTENTLLGTSVVARLEAGDTVRLSVAQSNEDGSSINLSYAKLALSWIGPAS